MFLRLLLLVSALVAFASPSTAERRAFVVGIDTYENIRPPLEKALNDAKSMAATFKGLGFEVALKLDANQEELLFAWTQFLSSIKPEDVVAVFFAGHGVQISGLNYLLPRDIPPADKGEELLKARSLGLAKMMDDLADRKPRVNLMIIDACRNNPFKAAEGKRSVGAGRGLAPIDQTRGTFVMYSAGAGQTALDKLTDADPDPNSVYTRRLLPLLKQPGLSLVQMAKQVQGEVAEDARTRYVWNGQKIAHPQSPAYYDGIEGNFFISGVADSASAAWEKIKDSINVAMLEAFITQFPGTTQAAQAQKRIAQVRSAEANKQAAMNKETEDKQKGILGDVDKVSPEAKPLPLQMPVAQPFRPGETFRDCTVCPEMVVVPAGSFMMGSQTPSNGNFDMTESERPLHQVTFSSPFAVGTREVSFQEWDACVQEMGCEHVPRDMGWGRGTQPVINISWQHATEQYIKWLNHKTKSKYRLLSEAEWEYAARAGTASRWSWGDDITTEQANFSGQITMLGPPMGVNRKKPVAIGSFAPNSWGLFDMAGNVAELVGDCWHENYEGAPSDGSAWVDRCQLFSGRARVGENPKVVRGGSFISEGWAMELRNRSAFSPYAFGATVGFRVARSNS